MEKTLALKVILWISVAGMLFSGFLSFSEVILRVCPIGGCGKMLGVPVCLYGFIMYCAVFAVSLMGLKCRCEKRAATAEKKSIKRKKR